LVEIAKFAQTWHCQVWIDGQTTHKKLP
jgi:hypothetical protein